MTSTLKRKTPMRAKLLPGKAVDQAPTRQSRRSSPYPAKPSIKPLPGILRTAQLPKVVSGKSGGKPRQSRMKSKRKSIPAHELAYLKRVAALPCAKCGIWGYSQAAHSNRAQDGKGIGKKADYRATFPMCCTRPGEIGCHVKHDQCIGMSRAEADERTTAYIERTQKALG